MKDGISKKQKVIIFKKKFTMGKQFKNVEYVSEK